MKTEDQSYFFGCFGNGTLVCDMKTYGPDGRKIAHISDHGVIKWYVAPNTIPETEKTRIEKTAEQDKAKFLTTWEKKDYIQKWDYMMSIPTIGVGYNAVQKINYENLHLSMEKRVKLMEKEFFQMHM